MIIHWLSLTIHAPADNARGFYDLWLRDAFGPYQPGPGGMFYSGSLSGLCGVRIYTQPIAGGDNYWTLTMPGLACECVSLEWFRALSIFLQGYEYKYSVTRLDLAFDDFPFSPAEMRDFCASGDIATPARPRGELNTLDEFFSGHDGHTWTIGSRQGGRFLRVYDRRGCNRLELELHQEHSNKAWSRIFIDDDRTSYAGFGRGLVEEFCRVRSGRVYHDKYNAWLSAPVILPSTAHNNARDVTIERSVNWLMNGGAAVLLSVLQDILGRTFVENLVMEGYIIRDKKESSELRYRGLLDLRAALPPSVPISYSFGGSPLIGPPQH